MMRKGLTGSASHVDILGYRMWAAQNAITVFLSSIAAVTDYHKLSGLDKTNVSSYCSSRQSSTVVSIFTYW